MRQRPWPKHLPACFGLGFALALFCGGCVNQHYEDGVQRAEREMMLGTPCFYTTSMADVRNIEPHTGLPYLVLESPITPELLKMMEGHNAIMLEKYHNSAKAEAEARGE